MQNGWVLTGRGDPPNPRHPQNPRCSPGVCGAGQADGGRSCAEPAPVGRGFGARKASRRTGLRMGPQWRITKRDRAASRWSVMRPGRTRCRRRPTLPRPLGRSTIGAVGLNDRVRNGNECGPYALVASDFLVLRPAGAGRDVPFLLLRTSDGRRSRRGRASRSSPVRADSTPLAWRRMRSEE